MKPDILGATQQDLLPRRSQLKPNNPNHNHSNLYQFLSLFLPYPLLSLDPFSLFVPFDILH